MRKLNFMLNVVFFTLTYTSFGVSLTKYNDLKFECTCDMIGCCVGIRKCGGVRLIYSTCALRVVSLFQFSKFSVNFRNLAKFQAKFYKIQKYDVGMT